MLDIADMSETERGIQFTFSKLTKTSRPGYHTHPIYLEKFEPDKRLCVVFYLREYLQKTQHLRGNITKLFLTYQKPHKAATKDTVARWVKKQLQECGVDISIFSPHSTRSASTSKASKLVPLSVVLKSAAWSNTSTFRKHYNKPVMSDKNFAHSILNSAVNARREKQKGEGEASSGE